MPITKYITLDEKKRRLKNGELPKIEVCPSCDANGHINWHSVCYAAGGYDPIHLIQCKVCKLVFDEDEIIQEKWD